MGSMLHSQLLLSLKAVRGKVAVSSASAITASCPLNETYFLGVLWVVLNRGRNVSSAEQSWCHAFCSCDTRNAFWESCTSLHFPMQIVHWWFSFSAVHFPAYSANYIYTQLYKSSQLDLYSSAALSVFTILLNFPQWFCAVLLSHWLFQWSVYLVHLN